VTASEKIAGMTNTYSKLIIGSQTKTVISAEKGWALNDFKKSKKKFNHNRIIKDSNFVFAKYSKIVSLRIALWPLTKSELQEALFSVLLAIAIIWNDMIWSTQNLKLKLRVWGPCFGFVSQNKKWVH
jgi:hypothetical protein